MILRTSALLLIAAVVVYTKPVQNADLSAVNTFLASLAASDSRTDSLVTLNYQNMASKKSPDHDNAKDPLFSRVDSSVSSGATYTAIANLLKFYTYDSDVAQLISDDFTTAINNFLDIFIASDAVQQSWTFLQSQGVSTADASAFRQQLYNLWFLPYARNQVAGSSGFKSVFFGEATGTTINRFANWYGFYLQEKSSVFNYHGWFTKVNGGNKVRERFVCI
uniref:Poly(U)-specific endoribonuclease n=1 Tax=Caenorhabditis japonica TaxID=281687 RepID=A0A8R1I2V7_CAEJA